MTFNEAMQPDMIGRAARRVWCRFRHVPGFYLEAEDFKQIGAWSAWRIGAKIETMDKALLCTIM